MRKAFFILFMATAVQASGPRYLGQSSTVDPKQTYANGYQEAVNIYHDISYPVISVGTASTMTITSLSISTITLVSSMTVTKATIKGVTDGSNACAGCLGEYIQSVVGSANAPSSTHYNDLTSIALTAGDWDVSLGAFWDSGGATWSQAVNGISTTAGDSSSGLNAGENDTLMVWANSSSTPLDVTAFIASYRMSLSGNTTVYLKFKSVYTGGPPTCQGRLSARRVH